MFKISKENNLAPVKSKNMIDTLSTILESKFTFEVISNRCKPLIVEIKIPISSEVINPMQEILSPVLTSGTFSIFTLRKERMLGENTITTTDNMMPRKH